MSQANWMLEETVDRNREIAEARTQLMESAKQQGVLPINEASELQGSPIPEDAGNDDVDDLLRLLREWREEDLTRSSE